MNLAPGVQDLIEDPVNQAILEAFQPTELELFLLTYLQHRITDPMPDFHRSLLAAVENADMIAILAPRKHGKSVLLTEGYPAYAICTQKNRGILIASANATEAKRRVKDLRFLFETNEMLRRTFHVKLGREFNGNWSASDLDFMINGQLYQVWGRGMTSQIRGIHPDLVIIDDPEETKGAASADVRNMVFDVYTRSILPTRNPRDNMGRKAKIFLIGTPINPEVLVQKAFVNWDGRFEGFTRLRFKAIEDGETVNLTGVPIGESIFPGRFPLSYLEGERKAMGPHAFAAEYLCNPMAAGSQLFYEEYFTQRYTGLPPAHHLITLVSVDPARTIQDSKTLSDTAIIAGSIERNNYGDPLIYVRGAKGGHLAPKERARGAVQMALDHNAQGIWVEDTTRAKGSGVEAPSDVVDLIRSEADNVGAGGKFFVLAHRPDSDKYTRATIAAVECEQQHVMWPEILTGPMYTAYSQIVLFPNTQKSDYVDAFTQLILKLKERGAGARSESARGGTVSRAPAFVSKRNMRTLQPLTRSRPWR